MSLPNLLAKLKNVRTTKAGWTARCPAHEDHQNSLSVAKPNGKWLLHCHAGCNIENICGEMGIDVSVLSEPKHKLVTTYDYVDERGTLLFQVCRFEPKKFLQRRPDGAGGWIWKLGNVRRVLYRLPEVIEAIATEKRVIVCEGEKDVDNLRSIGVVATCNPGGASKGKPKWLPQFSELLRDADVVVIPDADESGRTHGNTVAAALQGIASRVRMLKLPKKDVSAWLEAGGNAEQLNELIERCGEWAPQSAPTVARHVKGAKQADVLIEIALSADLFHAPDASGYADVAINGHRETWPIRRNGFRQWLARAYYEREHGAPNSEAMQSALAIVEARAKFDAPERQIHVRVGAHDGRLYLDLADTAWRTVEIDASGWRVIDSPPIRFRRAAGMLALPVPAPGGSIDALRNVINVRTDDDYTLIVAWLLAALRGRGPYPVLGVSGEQGSAKSTMCGMLRALIDPNTAPLRALPRDDRDLFIAANNAHVPAFDNVSTLPTWLSDTLCRLATGGGFAVRALWTDQDETLFDAMRPVMLNGIEAAVTRPDLADRALLLTLEAIPDDRRRPEGELWAELERERPRILGALLDAVVRGLGRLQSTRLDRLPRMADFALWASACESALWQAGTFDRAYSDNRREAVENVLEADLLAIALRKYMAERSEWEGTAGELLQVLTTATSEAERAGKSWPVDSTRVSGRLRRVLPSLRQAGVGIEFLPRDGRRRPIRITAARTRGDIASPSVTASPASLRDRVLV
jgi:5S rRNA maturation endonuclease (ribonuclease M5)